MKLPTSFGPAREDGGTMNRDVSGVHTGLGFAVLSLGVRDVSGYCWLAGSGETR